MPYSYSFEFVPNRSGSWDSNYTRSASQTYICITDDPTADPARIKSQFASSSFGIGLWYEFVDGEGIKCYVTRIDAKQREESDTPFIVWDITVSYSNQIDQGGGGGGGSGGGGGITPVNASPAASIAEQQQGVLPADRIQNPLIRPPTIKYSTQMVKIYQPFDALGNFYTNTLGDPYDDVNESEAPMVVYKIGVNYPNYTYYNSLLDHVGKTNNASFVIRGKNWPRYCLRFLSIDNIEPICENDISYDRFEYTLVGWLNPVWNPTLLTPAYEYWGHRVRRPNMGRREFATTGLPGGAYLKPIVDKTTRQPIINPAFLTSGGVAIDTTVTNWFNTVGWQTFQPHMEFDFSLLL